MHGVLHPQQETASLSPLSNNTIQNSICTLYILPTYIVHMLCLTVWGQYTMTPLPAGLALYETFLLHSEKMHMNRF